VRFKRIISIVFYRAVMMTAHFRRLGIYPSGLTIFGKRLATTRANYASCVEPQARLRARKL
jgi:hypothetical protein